MRARLTALTNERREVEFLLEAARRTEMKGPDAKAEALLDWIYRLQQEETDPDLKVLVFTEFVSTQEMLYEFLTERGMEVVCLNGSMGMDERKRVQEAFAGQARILVSTDAGGEGLNLQFCHVIVNYDLPWNPMRLEQRIGRVDRIGQTHPVCALNFVLQDSVEYRVRTVLEEKLAVILSEFGVDKTGDVLDSAQAGRIFDDLYVESILDPENLDAKVESAVRQVREQAELTRDSVSILGGEDNLDAAEAQQMIDHPLPYWVERMTTSYLASHGGKAVKRGKVWELTWPTGEKVSNVVFAARDAEANPSARHLTLEDDRVRKLATHLPAFTDGQLVPVLRLLWLPADVRGYWSLWRISVHGPDLSHRRMMPLFLQDDGRVFLPTSRRIWDHLLSESVEPSGYVERSEATRALERSREIAESQGKPLYEGLVQAHYQRRVREREKGEYAFASRRRAISRIGLPAVRVRRLMQLDEEERTWRAQLDKRTETLPEMEPLLLIRVEGGNHA